MFNSRSQSQKQLAGLLPQRPSLAQIRMEENFAPHLHPFEKAHATPGAHTHEPDKDSNDYFMKSGMAHHQSHSAHEISAMLKSGELDKKEKGHHENALAAHQHAVTLHKQAGDAALKAGMPWMAQAHGGHAQGHETPIGRHMKALGQ